jgi:hypothetical protein
MVETPPLSIPKQPGWPPGFRYLMACHTPVLTKDNLAFQRVGLAGHIGTLSSPRYNTQIRIMILVLLKREWLYHHRSQYNNTYYGAL